MDYGAPTVSPALAPNGFPKHNVLTYRAEYGGKYFIVFSLCFLHRIHSILVLHNLIHLLDQKLMAKWLVFISVTVSYINFLFTLLLSTIITV